MCLVNSKKTVFKELKVYKIFLVDAEGKLHGFYQKTYVYPMGVWLKAQGFPILRNSYGLGLCVDVGYFHACTDCLTLFKSISAFYTMMTCAEGDTRIVIAECTFKGEGYIGDVSNIWQYPNGCACEQMVVNRLMGLDEVKKEILKGDVDEDTLNRSETWINIKHFYHKEEYHAEN